MGGGGGEGERGVGDECEGDAKKHNITHTGMRGVPSCSGDRCPYKKLLVQTSPHEATSGLEGDKVVTHHHTVLNTSPHSTTWGHENTSPCSMTWECGISPIHRL